MLVQFPQPTLDPPDVAAGDGRPLLPRESGILGKGVCGIVREPGQEGLVDSGALEDFPQGMPAARFCLGFLDRAAATCSLRRHR